MPEVVEITLDELLVDPTLFSPRRSQPIDEAYLARVVESIEDGERPEPLRVAMLAEPGVTEWSCRNLHTQQAIAGWQSRQRKIPWANRPLAPELVLIDGLTRYHALRLAGEKRVEVVVDAEPAGTRAEILLRATEANARNARHLGDPDLRSTFALLWLGREVRESHERWRPERGAVATEEICRRLRRSEGWASRMRTWLRLGYLTGCDLVLSAASELARLPEDDWRPFCWEHDYLRLHPLLDAYGQPRGEAATVPEMTVADLRRLVEVRLNQFEGRATPGGATVPESKSDAMEEPEVDARGQYVMDFEVDTVTPLDQLRQIRAVREQLPVDRLESYYAYANLMLAEASDTVEKLRPLLRAAGREV